MLFFILIRAKCGLFSTPAGTIQRTSVHGKDVFSACASFHTITHLFLDAGLFFVKILNFQDQVSIDVSFTTCSSGTARGRLFDGNRILKS